ncbi:xanthine dehydrogenase family protein subunit M [Thermoanaerobacteraceae bacterium SP2]|nr:xanthine dehydrogenase family protein subunit M [Thermoanaerobacteraceae bacterium SP2]
MVNSDLYRGDKVVKFQFVEPRTVDEVCTLLSEYEGKAKVIAGGTDLVVQMRAGKIDPALIISINMLGLNKINYNIDTNVVSIGSLVTNDEVSKSPIIKEYVPLLAEASRSIGGRQTRNLGTIGGNVCNASPAADTPPALMVLGCKLRVAGLRGNIRSIDVMDFFKGPGLTTLEKDEIVTALEVTPIRKNLAGHAFLKLGIRKAMEISIVNTAIIIELDPQDPAICQKARIALGAVAPTPIRAIQAENILMGQKLDDNCINQVAEAAAQCSKPITDFRASAEYRKEMVKVLVKRGIQQAIQEAYKKASK